jgi:hypothetical protein
VHISAENWKVICVTSSWELQWTYRTGLKNMC